MIVSYVKSTGNQVMVCAEMTYEIELGKAVLVDPLPAEIKKNVVWRDSYWLPDEAASIYAKAQAVISVECHSPLIALHRHADVLRPPATDTCKGQMYRDIGANDWFFEVDETSGPQLWSRLGAIVKDPAKVRESEVDHGDGGSASAVWCERCAKRARWADPVRFSHERNTQHLCTRRYQARDLAPGSRPNALAAAGEIAGWKLLFDGKSLDGWRS